MVARLIAVKAVAARDDVALELVQLALVAVADAGPLALEVAQADLVDLEQQRPAARQPRLDQVLDDLRLAVDDDRLPAGELVERDPLPGATRLQLDPRRARALRGACARRRRHRRTARRPPCSSTPARIRASTYSRLRFSRITESIPSRWRSWASVSPAGPAPTIPTCVLVTPAVPPPHGEPDRRPRRRRWRPGRRSRPPSAGAPPRSRRG